MGAPGGKRGACAASSAGGSLHTPGLYWKHPAFLSLLHTCDVQNVLRNDMIPHGWMPVSRYQEIEDDFSKYYRPDEEVSGQGLAGTGHAPAGRCSLESLRDPA